MVLATLLLTVLFIAGVINIFFYIPTNKIRTFFQILFPNNNNNVKNGCKTTKMESDANYGKEEEELKKVFSTFDKNGDGFITRQEFMESLRIFMNEKEIDDIIVKFDSNKDGLIDFDEFCLLTRECMGGGEKKEKEKEGVNSKERDLEEIEGNLKEAFDVFDKDNDGLISEEELGFVLNALGLREGKKIEECKEMIRKVDMDGDGMVDFNEFKIMMKKGGAKLVFNA